MIILERVLLIRPLHIKHGRSWYYEDKANLEVRTPNLAFLPSYTFQRGQQLNVMDLNANNRHKSA